MKRNDIENYDLPENDPAQQRFDSLETPHSMLVARYIHLTKIVMPTLSKTTKRHWPVSNDHCFQRIVLDNICDGVWYEQITRPAYQHLSEEQAARALQLCEQIIAEKIVLRVLNHQSLAWRRKDKKISQPASKIKTD